MNEALFVFSALASTVHLLLWTREPERAYHLIWAGLFSFLTAFNRYEGWFFVIGQAVILLIVAWRLRGRRWAVGTSLLFAHVAFAAPALWLGWNWLIFGDPLFFLHNDYTSAGSQQSLALAGLLPTKDHPLVAIEYFWRAMVHILGFWPTAIGALTFGLCMVLIPVLLVLRRKKTDQVSALLVVSALTVPLFFLLFTLVQGVTALHVPDAPPFGEYNVRYALFAFPALVGFLSIVIKAGQRVSPLLPWGVLVLLLIGIIPVWKLPWIGLVEAQGNKISNERRAKAVDFILNQYDTGDRFLISAASEERSVTPESETKILISAGSGAGNPLMHHLGLSMSSFIHEGANEIWDQALENPENHVEWVIMTNADPKFNRDKVYEQFMAHPELLAHYELAYKDGALEVYHLRNSIRK